MWVLLVPGVIHSQVIQSKEYLLSTENRPKEIGRWIASGRRGPPSIQKLPRYAASWKKWWSSLQPDSWERKLVRNVDAGEKWEGLQKGSINGFFNIVISLVWWHAAITNPSQRKAHEEMVEDVSWVLDWMLDDRKHGKKRAAGSSDEDAEPRV